MESKPPFYCGMQIRSDKVLERLSVGAGVAQEGGGGGYHCSSAAGYPKLASTLEIPALEQVGPFCCFLLPVLAHSGQSARCPVLGVQRHQSSDSHHHPPLGPPLGSNQHTALGHDTVAQENLFLQEGET